MLAKNGFDLISIVTLIEYMQMKLIKNISGDDEREGEGGEVGMVRTIACYIFPIFSITSSSPQKRFASFVQCENVKSYFSSHLTSTSHQHASAIERNDKTELRHHPAGDDDDNGLGLLIVKLLRFWDSHFQGYTEVITMIFNGGKERAQTIVKKVEFKSRTNKVIVNDFSSH